MSLEDVARRMIEQNRQAREAGIARFARLIEENRQARAIAQQRLSRLTLALHTGDEDEWRAAVNAITGVPDQSGDNPALVENGEAEAMGGDDRDAVAGG